MAPGLCDAHNFRDKGEDYGYQVPFVFKARALDLKRERTGDFMSLTVLLKFKKKKS